MAFANPSTQHAQADINITPLVDVLLVLLVIFMMTAPVLSRPIPVELPQASPPDAARVAPEPVLLRIDAAGGLAWNGEAISLQALPALLAGEVQRAPAHQPILQIDADGDSDYQTVAGVLAAANGAGLHDIGFVRRR